MHPLLTFLATLLLRFVLGGALGAGVALGVRWALRRRRRPAAPPVPPRDTGTRTTQPPPVAPDSPAALGARIAQVLGGDLCVIGVNALPGMVLEIHVGPAGTPKHRPATREEWDRCIAAGVPLLSWEHAALLRTSLSSGGPGAA